MSVLWASVECTLNGIWWTMSERRVQVERKWTVNDIWTQNEKFIQSLWEISLHCVSLVIKVANKLYVECCHRESWQKMSILSYFLHFIRQIISILYTIQFILKNKYKIQQHLRQFRSIFFTVVLVYYYINNACVGRWRRVF